MTVVGGCGGVLDATAHAWHSKQNLPGLRVLSPATGLRFAFTIEAACASYKYVVQTHCNAVSMRGVRAVISRFVGQSFETNEDETGDSSGGNAWE